MRPLLGVVEPAQLVVIDQPDTDDELLGEVSLRVLGCGAEDWRDGVTPADARGDVVLDHLLDGVLRLLLCGVDVRCIGQLEHPARGIAHLPRDQALEVVHAELEHFIAVVLRERDRDLAYWHRGGRIAPAPRRGDVGPGEFGRLVVELLAPVLGGVQGLAGSVHQQPVQVPVGLVVVRLGPFATPDDDDVVLGQLVVQRRVGDRGQHYRGVHGHDDLGLGPVARGVGRRELALALEEGGVARAGVLGRSLVGAGPVEAHERSPVVLPALVDLGVERPQGLASLLGRGSQSLGSQNGIDLGIALTGVEDVVDVSGVDPCHGRSAVVAPVPDRRARRHVDVARGPDLAAVLVAVAQIGCGGGRGSVRAGGASPSATSGYACRAGCSSRGSGAADGDAAGSCRRTAAHGRVRTPGPGGHAPSCGRRAPALRPLRWRQSHQENLNSGQRDEREVSAPERPWRHSHGLTPPAISEKLRHVCRLFRLPRSSRVGRDGVHDLRPSPLRQVVTHTFDE